MSRVRAKPLAPVSHAGKRQHPLKSKRTPRVSLADCELIMACEKLLFPGLHTIRVSTIAEGRKILKVFFSFYSGYQRIGCMSLHTPIPLYAEIILPDSFYLKNDDPFSFIWIEETPNLQRLVWYDVLQEQLASYAYHIPIIKFSYRRA